MQADVSLQRIADKVKKLLAVAASGSGATEHEAATAASRAEAIMAEYGLEMAAIVASGGEGEARVKEGTGNAFFNYQNELMEVIAEICYCYMSVRMVKKSHGRGFTERTVREGFDLIGRKSSVAAARVLFEYLDATILRLSKEAKPEVPKWYRRGMAERLGERLKEEHRERLERQKDEAERANREAAARSSHPSAAPSSANALVPVLADYAASEASLNEDMRRGLAPGTTARRAAESEQRIAKRDAAIAELEAQGIRWPVAWDMVYYGYSREKAESMNPIDQRPVPDQLTDAERKKREAREEKDWQRSREKRRKEDEKRASSSWRSGRRDGDDVSLNQQIGAASHRKLT